VCASLREEGEDLVRAAEEILVFGLYRERRLSAPDAMAALGITSRMTFEQKVAEHHAQQEWSVEEVEHEMGVNTLTGTNQNP
jgi:hypothetical protein